MSSNAESRYQVSARAFRCRGRPNNGKGKGKHALISMFIHLPTQPPRELFPFALPLGVIPRVICLQETIESKVSVCQAAGIVGAVVG